MHLRAQIPAIEHRLVRLCDITWPESCNRVDRHCNKNKGKASTHSIKTKIRKSSQLYAVNSAEMCCIEFNDKDVEAQVHMEVGLDVAKELESSCGLVDTACYEYTPSNTSNKFPPARTVIWKRFVKLKQRGVNWVKDILRM